MKLSLSIVPIVLICLSACAGPSKNDCDRAGSILVECGQLAAADKTNFVDQCAGNSDITIDHTCLDCTEQATNKCTANIDECSSKCGGSGPMTMNPGPVSSGSQCERAADIAIACGVVTSSKAEFVQFCENDPSIMINPACLSCTEVASDPCSAPQGECAAVCS